MSCIVNHGGNTTRTISCSSCPTLQNGITGTPGRITLFMKLHKKKCEYCKNFELPPVNKVQAIQVGKQSLITQKNGKRT